MQEVIIRPCFHPYKRAYIQMKYSEWVQYGLMLKTNSLQQQISKFCQNKAIELIFSKTIIGLYRK
jgi:hypothetical protein